MSSVAPYAPEEAKSNSLQQSSAASDKHLGSALFPGALVITGSPAFPPLARGVARLSIHSVFRR